LADDPGPKPHENNPDDEHYPLHEVEFDRGKDTVGERVFYDSVAEGDWLEDLPFRTSEVHPPDLTITDGPHHDNLKKCDNCEHVGGEHDSEDPRGRCLHPGCGCPGWDDKEHPDTDPGDEGEYGETPSNGDGIEELLKRSWDDGAGEQGTSTLLVDPETHVYEGQDTPPNIEEYTAEPGPNRAPGTMRTPSRENRPDLRESSAQTDEEMGPEELARYQASLSYLMDSGNGDEKIAQATQEFLDKMAGRNYSPAEQKALIDEPGTARNAHKLRLEGTHYEKEMGKDPEDVLAFMF